jgi:hypothetical protein
MNTDEIVIDEEGRKWRKTSERVGIVVPAYSRYGLNGTRINYDGEGGEIWELVDDTKERSPSLFKEAQKEEIVSQNMDERLKTDTESNKSELSDSPVKTNPIQKKKGITRDEALAQYERYKKALVAAMGAKSPADKRLREALVYRAKANLLIAEVMVDKSKHNSSK